MSRSGRGSRRRALPLLLGVSLLLTAFAGLLVTDRAAAVIIVINGDWTVSGTNIYDGTTFKVDGDVTITTGALLEIRNGGLVFLNDVGDDHNLDIQDGGSGHGTLLLVNSLLTTEGLQSDADLDLDVTVAGTLILRGGSIQKHPGTLTTSGDASLEVRESTITGFLDAEISQITNLTDFYNDAPRMTFGDFSTVLIVNSTVERLYENASAPRPNPDYDIRVESSAVLTVVDSYVGVDFTPGTTTRNTILGSGSSRVYVYNLTVDEVQSFSVPLYLWESALLTSGASAEIYIHRWLEVKVADRFGNGIPGAYVESRTTPDGFLAVYPRNGGANTPSSDLLDHVGVTAGTFNITGPSGSIRIPLLTERIDSTTLPNSEFNGTYRLRASFGSDVAFESVVFDQYPVLTAANNTRSPVVSFGSLVYPAQDTTYVWSSTMTIDFDIQLDGNVRVTGDVTLDGANLSILQADMDAGRHYIMLESEGSLTVRDGFVFSNLPLIIYLQDNTQFMGENATLALNTPEGRGMIYGQDASVISLLDGSLEGDLEAHGAAASLRGVAFSNADLTLNATGTSYLWDPTFGENVVLDLRSDDGNAATLDFDIRNVTVDADRNDSFRFSGAQYVQLTNVTFDNPALWWEGRIADNAKVGLFWWLVVSALDGVGSPIQDANITLERLDPVTVQFVPIPTPGPDDLYLGTPQPTHVEAPAGIILYRAQSQERVAAQGWANNTYLANGSKVIGATFYADANATTIAAQNAGMNLVFTVLTPEFILSGVSFSGGNGTGDVQPINLPLALQASVVNPALIPFSGVTVHFYHVDVDANDDGMMDNDPANYAPFLIGSVNTTVEADSTLLATVPWTPQDIGTYVISAVVDQSNTYPEPDELNNLMKRSLTITMWPNLGLQASTINLAREPVEDGPVDILVRVENLGTAPANAASVELWVNGSLVDAATVTIAAGSSESVLLTWTPATAGNHTLVFRALSLNNSPDNTDYDFANNVVQLDATALTKPDLELRAADYQPLFAVLGRSFTVSVNVYNVGVTNASNFNVSLYLDSVLEENRLASMDGLSIPAGQNLSFVLEATAVVTAGNYTLIILADAQGVIPEEDEGNNLVTFSLQVVPPEGQVFILSPEAGQFFALGDQVFVSGRVTTPSGQPIPDIQVIILARDSEGTPQLSTTSVTDANGDFLASLSLPMGAPSGIWTLVISTDAGGIDPAILNLNIERVVPWYEMPVPFVGLPLWVLLAVLAVFVVVAVAVTGYMRSYGLGKLVECGECGAFISDSSTTCPKCGTEFEKEMAKCSSCHAWIPADVKKCPECGVEFTTGKTKGGDYKGRMKQQYQRVVDKYRAEATIALGHKPSEKEFQEWWRRQPTYVTFNEWLKEDEEMRKMGSRPCPRCRTLNALTATVCHKCGALLSSESSGGGPSLGGGGATPPPAPPPATSEGQPVERPILKKIVKKPFAKKRKK